MLFALYIIRLFYSYLLTIYHDVSASSLLTFIRCSTNRVTLVRAFPAIETEKKQIFYNDTTSSIRLAEGQSQVFMIKSRKIGYTLYRLHYFGKYKRSDTNIICISNMNIKTIDLCWPQICSWLTLSIFFCLLGHIEVKIPRGT